MTEIWPLPMHINPNYPMFRQFPPLEARGLKNSQFPRSWSYIQLGCARVCSPSKFGLKSRFGGLKCLIFVIYLVGSNPALASNTFFNLFLEKIAIQSFFSSFCIQLLRIIWDNTCCYFHCSFLKTADFQKCASMRFELRTSRSK